ncbi:glycosyltransferase family 2 protein [Ulvibacter litoralis]|uniref:Glycosyltransferase, GT2 family n=1 Tax=Ulvibacter litoralis TaxID=227084 RepID=A0A1G7GV90_9FLAO|nr:glycosyltransferase [Ulvibacter litoralis]GHC59987.1 hypothetical protein GCM10008083_26240 [Ulvibacter litoralis]SDE91994.1 Glycosyltransferase, GT2 family [Ulvibacter litoralis]
MIEPLISIVLPVYNGGRYLKQSIESCLSQTYKNIELIIVDDCSTDNSLEIANEFAIRDNRVKVHRNKVNSKLPASLNIGHFIAKGDFITWTSDDNYYQKDALKGMYNKLNKNNADIVYADYLIIDEEGVLRNSAKLKPLEYLMFYGVIGACFLYRKQVYERNNGYNENFFLVEDYDFFLRALRHSVYTKIDHPGYYYYRYHPNSLTVKMKSDEVLKAKFILNLKKLYSNFFNDTQLKNKDILISFLVNRFLHGPHMDILPLESNSLLSDLTSGCASLKNFSTERLNRIVISDSVDTIFKNKKFQNIKSLYYLHTKGKHIILRLTVSRYLALIKKCTIG